MKIINLKINGYKNLEAELIHSSDIIAFIGSNGSGKSNLLEAISHIFRSLFVSKYTINFDYFIEYETSKKNRIIIEKKGKTRTFLLDDKPVSDLSNYLPQKVIAIYSGEEARLFDECFGPFYLEFVNNINKAQTQGTEYSELPKMLFLNKFYWNISLLSLLISTSKDNKDFVKNVLKIDKVNKIKIDFIKKNYEKYNDNKALRLVRDIDVKAEYELEEFRTLLSEKGYIADDLYKYLYLAYSPKDSKIINDIVIEFNDFLTVADFSEGEKKLLLIKGALEFAGQEDSIFILDEPDSHIHINNKEQITKSFEPYQHNRQIIITTHSPTLTQCMKDENVYMLNSGKIEDKNRQDIIQGVAGDFWNKHQQNSFLSSKKPIILLVEGKHDKLHIVNAYNKLSDEYPTLNFDIFSLGGESKIHPFMNGLYEANIQNDVIYIGIYDNDNAGTTTLNKAGFEPDSNNYGYRKLKKDKTEHNHFFAFPLIKPVGFTKDCTIENMFVPEKYEEAFKEALNKSIGHFSNKSIEDINKDIKENSKNVLADNSKNFDKEDFVHFRKIFDLIKSIKAFTTPNPVGKVVIPEVILIKEDRREVEVEVEVEVEEVEKKTENSPIVKEVILFQNIKKGSRTGRTVSENQHLKGKEGPIKSIYKLLKAEIQDKNSDIEIIPKVEYIAFKLNGKNVFDIKIQKNNIKLWVNKKNRTMPAVLSDLFDDVSNKGHHGNGDFEKTFTNEAEVRAFIDFDAISQILKLL
ncbi:AAA family ATPase [Flavobacterium sp. LS2P90]|uniref:AAA family ATPase n=1 Tax=Flavobacterium xylosi TaxID=3230415 RepID=A0ABW6HR54_9FLAO